MSGLDYGLSVIMNKRPITYNMWAERGAPSGVEFEVELSHLDVNPLLYIQRSEETESAIISKSIDWAGEVDYYAEKYGYTPVKADGFGYMQTGPNSKYGMEAGLKVVGSSDGVSDAVVRYRAFAVYILED